MRTFFSKTAFLWLGLLISCGALAINTSMTPQYLKLYSMAAYDQAITKFYQWLDTQDADANLGRRIDLTSQYFLNKPYLFGALGEGPNSEFDQSPLYRDDAFDCLTYVATVVALVASKDLYEFQKNIRLVNYENGDVNFSKRNHFTSTDWNINNQKQGFIRDITAEIKNPDGSSPAISSTVTIDKPAWFQHLKISQLKFLNKESEDKVAQCHKNLCTLSVEHKPTQSNVTYLPFTALFDQNGKPNQYLIDQIPNGAIVEIVRPKWDLRKQIGTYLQISHLGFAIKTNQGLMFREASRDPRYMRVVDVPLVEYLQDARQSPTIKGINLQLITKMP